MDIRKWFTSPKGTAPANPPTKSKDDDKSNKQNSSKKSSKSKKRRIIESDSDEDPIPKEDEKDLKKSSPKEKQPKKTPASKPPPEKRKEVSVADFFGSASVSRSKDKSFTQNKKVKEDPPLSATSVSLNEEKQRQNSVEKKNKKVEEEIIFDDDDDFAATLLELDKAVPVKEVKVNGKDKAPTTSEKKKERKSSVKRKPKHNSSIEMEITSPPEKKHVVKIIKEDKPAAKKPRKSDGASYASYLHREGPKALGSKEIPEGEEDCLLGLTFLVTGVLESMERDEAKTLIESHGGKVMTTLSKNTRYIVIGRDAGSSKLEKAEKLKTKQLDEDGLLDLVRTLPGKNKKRKPKPTPEAKTETVVSPVKKSSPLKLSSAKKKSIKSCDDESDEFTVTVLSEPVNKSKSIEQKIDVPTKLVEDSSTEKQQLKRPTELSPSMWVDKYKPSSLKQLIGQQGDKSNAKKLLQWVVNWHKNRTLNKKPISGRFNTNDDGSGFKAALLSGPPGVGKTTTAQLVCKEAGYDFFELNASDTRSKKSLQQAVSQLLGNQTLADCLKDGGKVSSKHLIIMDEVDGMAGNEDRGGMMELIGFIKASKVPIVCICNDRNHQKIRSLANHCFDLRFQRPRVEQIKAAMMSIAFKEHIKVTPDVLQDVIVASNQDIRQVLHNMSMWSANSKGLTKDQTKSDIGRGTKHIKLSPFDVLREVFAIGNNPNATFIDKSDLFFHDYSMAPLFVQENYVHVIPSAAEGDKNKHLTLLSEAANSICMGDMIDRQIRSQMSWGLLPTQAVFASVVPGELLKGHLRQMINFPAWLGKNSSRAHMDRVLQELHVHMRMRITGNKTDIALDYLPLLKRALTKPLVERESEGVPEVLRIMEDYFLLREDFDSIIDLSLWQGQTDPRTKIQTKVKSAFTRAYNKESGKNPYAVSNVKKKKVSAKDSEAVVEDDAVESEEEEDESIEKDAMIKVKKPAPKDLSSKASTSKEKKKNPPKKGKSK